MAADFARLRRGDGRGSGRTSTGNLTRCVRIGAKRRFLRGDLAQMDVIFDEVTAIVKFHEVRSRTKSGE